MPRTPRIDEEVEAELVEAVRRVYATIYEVYGEQYDTVKRVYAAIGEAYNARLDEALCLFHGVESPSDGGWPAGQRAGIARVLNAYDLTDAEYDARYGTDAREESTR